MALAIATVVDSIAALSVTGLSIKDMDEIPPGVEVSQPTLIPLPDFMTDWEIETQSFGPGSSAKFDAFYTLNYRLCYIPVGAGKPLEYFDNMVSMVAAFLDAVIAASPVTGSITLTPVAVFNMGIVNDPADQSFYGCDIAIRVMEFIN